MERSGRTFSRAYECAEPRMDWDLLLMVMGFVLIVEGLPYVLFPERITRLLEQLERLGPGALRAFGLVSLLAGVLLLSIGRWLL